MSPCRINIRRKDTFLNIKDGKKQIEGRLYKGMFKHIYPGDKLQVVHDNENVCIEIVKISIYPTMYTMLMNPHIREKCIPHLENIEDSYNYYCQFYNRKLLQKKSAIAIYFKLIY